MKTSVWHVINKMDGTIFVEEILLLYDLFLVPVTFCTWLIIGFMYLYETGE